MLLVLPNYYIFFAPEVKRPKLCCEADLGTLGLYDQKNLQINTEGAAMQRLLPL